MSALTSNETDDQGGMDGCTHLVHSRLLLNQSVVQAGKASSWCKQLWYLQLVVRRTRVTGSRTFFVNKTKKKYTAKRIDRLVSSSKPQ